MKSSRGGGNGLELTKKALSGKQVDPPVLMLPGGENFPYGEATAASENSSF